MQTIETERHFVLVLLVIILLLVLAIFYPFLTVLILGATFATVLSPIHSWLNRHITRGISWLASVLTIILFLLIICVPLSFLGIAVVNQLQDSYTYIAHTNSGDVIQKFDVFVNKFVPNGLNNLNIHQKMIDLATSFSSNITKIFTYTFKTIVMFILTVITMFYLLNNGEKWKEMLIKLLPMSNKNAREIFAKLHNAVNRVIKGSFIVAIAQGLMAWIGFMIFGVPNATLWALVASLASFIPTFGTAVITVPAMIYLVITGSYLPAIGLLLWSMLVIATVDNMISPYVISKDSDISPLFILFSILGGVALMGPVGIIIGPLVISLFSAIVTIYKKEAHLDSTN